MKKLISLLSIAFTLNSAFAAGFVQSDWDSGFLSAYSFADGNVEVSGENGYALNYVGTPLKMSDGAKLTFGMSFDNDKLLAIETDYANAFIINPFEADTPTSYRFDLYLNSGGNMHVYSYDFDGYAAGFEAGETSQVTIEYVVQGTDVYANISVNETKFNDILLKSGISNEDSFNPSFSLHGRSMEPIIMNQFAYTGEVPEPATYAVIFGALALGFAAWRKRR